MNASDNLMSVMINPVTCWSSQSVSSLENEYFYHFLKTLHTRPDLITEHVVYNSGYVQQFSLSKNTKKLEKFSHNHYSVSYRMPYININNTTYALEIQLAFPLKVQPNPKNGKDKSYLVINEILGKGSFGSVKSGHILYQLDDHLMLNKQEIDPIVRKSLKKKLGESCATDAVAEAKVGRAYIGQDKVGIFNRVKFGKKKVYEIYMPKYPDILRHMINNGEIKKLSFSGRLHLVRNIAREIKIFHDKTGTVHHDIKPENIAVDPATLNVKLIDFGLANKINSSSYINVGTPGYIDTQLTKETCRSEKINDYYSWAIVCAETLLVNNNHGNFKISRQCLQFR